MHKATLHDGRVVAVKVQYPGVANSIDSDLKNLQRLVSNRVDTWYRVNPAHDPVLCFAADDDGRVP